VRQPKAWRRGDGGPWYTTIGGRKVWLAPASAGVREATEALARAVVTRGVAVEPRADLTVRDVVNLYLAHQQRAVAAGDLQRSSYEGCERFLLPFAVALGHLQALALTRPAAEDWIRGRADPHGNPSGRAWNDTTRARAAAMLSICFRWAEDAGHVARNPVRGLRGPTPLVREHILTREQADALIAAASPPLGRFLRALLLTGCRPGEVAGLTADRVDLGRGVWRVVDKIRGTTGVRHREVYLSTEAVELTREQLAFHPEGHVFRNSLGRPWECSAWGKAIKRYREALGYDGGAVAYAFRHLYCTSLLVAGVSVETAAVLMGHRDIKMVLRVYSKLKTRTDHLRDEARRAG
jgi:integrase